jgi:hypothetical protein
MSFTMVLENEKAVGSDTKAPVAQSPCQSVPRGTRFALSQVVDEKVVPEGLVLRERQLHDATLFPESPKYGRTYGVDRIDIRHVDPTDTGVTAVPPFLSNCELHRAKNNLVARRRQG